MRIVAIDDDLIDLELVQRSLCAYTDIQLDAFGSFDDAVDVIRDEHIDCVLLDLVLPGLEGFDGIKQIGELAVNTPVVLLTGSDDVDLYARAIQAGADECVCKDELNGRQLYRCLRNTVQRHRLQRQLEIAATTDTLTGLPNRAAMIETLESLRVKDAGDPIALVLMDIDDFKLINDSHGHDVGDQFLIQFAERLRNSAAGESQTLVSRFGGDEFVVLVRDGNPKRRVNELIRRIRCSLQNAFRIDGLEIFAAISTGAVVGCQGGCDYNELLREADTAMFASKSRGKSRHSWFDVPMRERTLERLALENSVRRAVDGEEFHLNYQPKVDLTTGEIIGFEALARWRLNGALISPNKFIPIAERTGCIHPLGNWVLRQACQQLEQWGRSGQSTNIAVNVSPVQLESRNLVRSVLDVLDEFGATPSCITLEVTESGAVGDVTDVVKKLARLRAEGLRISIDDFGTGHSSLSQLHQLPVDEVKLDRSFVRRVADEDIDPSNFSRVFVETVHVLAEALGLQAVAEGVETEEQREILVECGYRWGQGFHFSRPLSTSEATQWLASRPGQPLV